MSAKLEAFLALRAFSLLNGNQVFRHLIHLRALVLHIFHALKSLAFLNRQGKRFAAMKN
jgi:hypothetical protein